MRTRYEPHSEEDELVVKEEEHEKDKQPAEEYGLVVEEEESQEEEPPAKEYEPESTSPH